MTASSIHLSEQTPYDHVSERGNIDPERSVSMVFAPDQALFYAPESAFLPRSPVVSSKLHRQAHFCKTARGELPEWSNGAVSKTVVPFGVPRVQIPHSPPFIRIFCRLSKEVGHCLHIAVAGPYPQIARARSHF